MVEVIHIHIDKIRFFIDFKYNMHKIVLIFNLNTLCYLNLQYFFLNFYLYMNWQFSSTKCRLWWMPVVFSLPLFVSRSTTEPSEYRLRPSPGGFSSVSPSHCLGLSSGDPFTTYRTSLFAANVSYLDE